MLRFGIGPARPALRPGARTTSPTALRGQRVQGLRAARSTAGGVVRAHQRRPARAVARGARRADRARQAARRARALAWVVRRGRRQLALADREVPVRRGDAAAAARSWAPSEGDLLLFVADDAAVAAEALGALRLELGRRFGLIPEGRHDVAVGRRLPAVRAGTPTRTLGRRAPSVHRARPATSTRSRRAALARLRPRARRQRARRRLDPHHTPRGPAAGLRAARDRARTRRRRASASCSTRCATAPRRTAGSRWASTASRR